MSFMAQASWRLFLPTSLLASMIQNHTQLPPAFASLRLINENASKLFLIQQTIQLGLNYTGSLATGVNIFLANLERQNSLEMLRKGQRTSKSSESQGEQVGHRDFQLGISGAPVFNLSPCRVFRLYPQQRKSAGFGTSGRATGEFIICPVAKPSTHSRLNICQVEVLSIVYFLIGRFFLLLALWKP